MLVEGEIKHKTAMIDDFIVPLQFTMWLLSMCTKKILHALKWAGLFSTFNFLEYLVSEGFGLRYHIACKRPFNILNR